MALLAYIKYSLLALEMYDKKSHTHTHTLTIQVPYAKKEKKTINVFKNNLFQNKYPIQILVIKIVLYLLIISHKRPTLIPA